MKRIHRRSSEYCPTLLALLALTGCMGQDKDLGSSERSLEEKPRATENEQSSGGPDAGAQSSGNSAAATDAEGSNDSGPAVDLNPVPEMPSVAEDNAAPEPDDQRQPNEQSATAEQEDEAEVTEATSDAKPDAGRVPQSNSEGDEDSNDEPVPTSEEPNDEASPPDSAEGIAELDAGAGDSPEFGPPTRQYRGGGGGSFSMCSDVSFEAATAPGTVPEQLLGVWVGNIETTALALPSGSGRVTLTLAEEGATLVFGAVVDSSLIPAPWVPYVGPREGFVYNVPMGEVTHDVEFEGELYDLAVDFTLSQNEPLEPHCQARQSNPVLGEPGCYTCLPAEISDWELFRSDVNGVCVVDDNYSLPCSELGLCWQDCLCDADSCHYRPGYINQLRLNAEGQLVLPIDFYWLLPGSFTPNAPNDGLWAMLERQP